MGQVKTVGTTATTISNDGEYTIVTYHATQVIKWNEKEIIINTGGYRTVTTKNRINQASNQYGLGIYVKQKNGFWFVSIRDSGYFGNQNVLMTSEKVLIDRIENRIHNI